MQVRISIYNIKWKELLPILFFAFDNAMSSRIQTGYSRIYDLWSTPEHITTYVDIIRKVIRSRSRTLEDCFLELACLDCKDVYCTIRRVKKRLKDTRWDCVLSSLRILPDEA